MAVLIYVDDILIMGSDTFFIRNTIPKHNSKFTLKDFRDLSYVFQIKVLRIGDSFHLSQHKYIQKLLGRLYLVIKDILIHHYLLEKC